MRIVVVGIGNLGSAIARSLAHAYAPREIVLVDRGAETRKALATQYGCQVVDKLSRDCTVTEDDLLILTVKPQDASDVCAQLAPFVAPGAVVLSMMAGVRVDTLVKLLGTQRIVRAMPNLGASIDESATGYFFDSAFLSESDIEHVEGLLSRLGKRWRVEREELIDAFTAVAGTGPAYLCWLGEQVERVALELGLSERDAHAMILQTLKGSALYLERSGLTFAELRRRVSSPNGTTVAAVATLSESAADVAVQRAVIAAHKRARELGAPDGDDCRDD